MSIATTGIKRTKTLVAMQLREKFSAMPFKTLKDKLFTIAGILFGIALPTVIIYFVFYIGQLLGILTIMTMPLPATLLVFLFTILQFLSILACTAGLTKSLYFGGDNAILLVLPAKPNEVFLSKLLVYYLVELRRSLNFFLPLFFAFGFINGYGVLFYLIVLIMAPLIAVLPVLIGALLSIPAMWLVTFLRNQKYVQIFLFLLAFCAAAYFLFKLVGSIPPNVNIVQSFNRIYWAIQDFLSSFAQAFWPFAQLTYMVSGKTQLLTHTAVPLSSVYTFFGFIGALAVLALLVYAVARPLFFKMSSKPFEHKKRIFKTERKNRKHSKTFSSLKKEFLINLRTPNVFFSNFSFIIAMPLTIFFLNKVFASLDTRLSSQYMTFSFNLLVMFILLIASNIQMASVFSSEGKAVYLLKTKPASQKASMFAKAAFSVFVSTISIIATVAILHSVGNFTANAAVATFFIAMFLNLSHLFWSIQLDIIKPQAANYIGGENIAGTNPNEVKSAFIGFVISFLFFLASFVLFGENIATAWTKLVFIAALLFAVRTWLLIVSMRVYFKDI